ncbi:MAG TPA: hypothetical protein VHL56_00975 [Candidatus Limnocylindrales bacterium]|jgi:hypothetical protein|nr:hypothetical protein [Candidatus Limnocylindrales bacterium]
MTIAIRHLRSLFIAIIALAMSAGLAFGAAAPEASFGLAKAASHAPSSAGSGDEVTAGEDESTETDSNDETGEDAGDSADGADSADNCTTDPTDPATDLTTLTHGQIVCWAAHQPTPDGYANHGAWVSQWAKGDHGNAASTKTHGKGNGKNHQN